MNKKFQHGGKRPGAGCKPTGRKSFTIRMIPVAMKRLKVQADRLNKKSVGELLEVMTFANNR